MYNMYRTVHQLQKVQEMQSKFHFGGSSVLYMCTGCGLSVRC